MSALDQIVAAARKAPRRIVLAEGEDPRIVAGALKAAQSGIAEPVLVGRQDVVAKLPGGENLPVVDPATSEKTETYASAFFDLRRHKGLTEEQAADAIREPLNFAAMMVRQGDADGTIGGAVATTSDTVRAALQIIGRPRGGPSVSSFFLMALDKDHHDPKPTLTFADCGLIVEPTTAELAEIAIASAASHKALTGEEPRVAMLSFSTMGSAQHPAATRMAEATALTRAKDPDLLVDGELQFDAAFLPAVAASKAPGSPLAGAANVFVFPDLNAANIAYKIAQRVGGATAIGPILQGLSKPANDLSRGCTADDVFHLIAVTVAQANG